jgi:hypothetical protein
VSMYVDGVSKRVSMVAGLWLTKKGSKTNKALMCQREGKREVDSEKRERNENDEESRVESE